ncbi:MAG: glycosyltransferase family 2 protein [Pyrinomonadaceae bacterium]
MNPAPIVSIVMPAYNAAPYIGETLDSVFAQTFTDFEVIVVNDGSPDTVELERALEPYMSRIRYIKQKSLGAGAARNEGLRAAQSEFIAFLDADDLWLPNYLEEQLKFIGENDFDLVCADAMHFGDSPLAGKTYMEAFMESAPLVGEVTFLGLVSAEQSLITSGIVARRALIIEVGFFDERLRNSQDFDLWLRLLRQGARLAYQRQLLLRYRCHEKSLSGDEINRTVRQLRVFDKIESSFELTHDERPAVLRAIEGRRALLEFELGKLYLEQGDFEKSRFAFSKADSWRRSWKTVVAVLLSRIAPGFLQSLHMRNARKSTGHRNRTGI